jgi:hypothetical protein
MNKLKNKIIEQELKITKLELLVSQLEDEIASYKGSCKGRVTELANDWGKEVRNNEELKWEISELKNRSLIQRILNK